MGSRPPQPQTVWLHRPLSPAGSRFTKGEWGVERVWKSKGSKPRRVRPGDVRRSNFWAIIIRWLWDYGIRSMG